MNLSIGLIVTTLLFVALCATVPGKLKGYVALLAVLINAGISSVVAIAVLQGEVVEKLYYGGRVFGEIPIRMDALSAWFILLMNFTMITGILYGIRYMKAYQEQKANLSLHFSSFIVIHVAMLGIYVVQNGLAFLCVWELMAIASFLLIIFEHRNIEIVKAGINYLIQSHIGIVFLMLGFIIVYSHTGSFDFNAIGSYSKSASAPAALLLFACFFITFAIKAGFVPFHTWLPYAHPASPSHVSGIMSGVIIKLGIFGILRMLILIDGNYLVLGYLILILSAVTGVYGVMLAIIQHNVKKLLAYHSIENIGIIGMGIGLGCIGKATDNSYLALAGFAGALLHTLNHSLFKSLLFYCAGTVYQATHTMEIERLGGLIKKMPQTAILFLIAALAICGLPPFNGFISEFLLYSGLFSGIQSGQLSSAIIFILSIFGLVLIGGLAMLCFTKAFGIIFLGSERHPYEHPIKEAELSKLFPKYMVVLVILLIGLVPQLFMRLLTRPLQLFVNTADPFSGLDDFTGVMQQVSFAAWALVALVLLVLGIRKLITRKSIKDFGPTWGCGYIAPTPKLQYTANSFVRSYRKLVHPMLIMNKKENELKGVFPNAVHSHTHPYDKVEALFIDLPLKLLKGFMSKFRFLQNGNMQLYILYGVVFIFIAIMIPLTMDLVHYMVKLFQHI
ncbi:MAG: proton-conducting transporter membrane subunit [bacterium]|nr:proton-conducting transporter membrane subunit [bacterium]